MLPYLPVSFDLRLGTSDAPGYVNLGWPSVPCGRDNCSGGTSFRLMLGEVRGGFDFVMTRGPAIRGRTVALGTTRPVSATVDVYNAANNLRVWSGSSDASGQYASSALPAGSYFVRASAGAPDSTCSWYGDALCPNEMTPSDFAPAVAVATNDSTDTTSIDIGLRTLLILRNGFE